MYQPTDRIPHTTAFVTPVVIIIIIIIIILIIIMMMILKLSSEGRKCFT